MHMATALPPVELDRPATTAVEAPPRGRRRSRWAKALRRDWPLLVLAAPGVIYFVVFHYGALAGNIIAFKNYAPFIGIWASPWVGVDNFTRMFADPAFWQAVVNTLEIAVLQLVLYFPVPIGLAVLLHSLTNSKIQRFVQSVAYLPYFLSWVVVVALCQQVLGNTGLLNGMLDGAGLHHVSIMANPALFKPLMVLQIIWKESGWGTIIFLAALSNVDEQQYEAAAIDGAGPWRRFWHVTMPGIRPVIVLLLILRLGHVLSVGFEQIILQRDAVGPAAGEVLDTFVYYNGVLGGDWGYGAAAGLFKGVIGALLVFAANKLAHRLGEQGVYS
jgi:putative aldouronate transport system permease protein